MDDRINPSRARPERRPGDGHGRVRGSDHRLSGRWSGLDGISSAPRVHRRVTKVHLVPQLPSFLHLTPFAVHGVCEGPSGQC